MKTFFSYTQPNSDLVQCVRRAAITSLGEICLYDAKPSGYSHFLDKINRELINVTTLVFFVGEEIGTWQCYELKQFWTLREEQKSQPRQVIFIVPCSRHTFIST